VTLRAVDDAGRALELPGAPARVVSLVPSLTELVCALGAAARLVGVTRYCTDPPDVVARLPRVGGTKNPDRDEIRALRPDVVLVNGEENRREDFERLAAGGMALFVSFPTGVAEAARSVERLGQLLGAETAARALASRIDSALREAAAAVRRRRRLFCPIWRNPWMSFNRDTYVHDLLWWAGGDNVCARLRDRYPVVGLEQVAGWRPEVILLPDEPYRFTARHLASLEPLSATPAWRDGQIHFVDGQALSWYGPRTAPALRSFRSLLAAA
jgi:ABC-type Fe3+-hydroxamate transport system substrate-binding protein